MSVAPDDGEKKDDGKEAVLGIRRATRPARARWRPHKAARPRPTAVARPAPVQPRRACPSRPRWRPASRRSAPAKRDRQRERRQPPSSARCGDRRRDERASIPTARRQQPGPRTDDERPAADIGDRDRERREHERRERPEAASSRPGSAHTEPLRGLGVGHSHDPVRAIRPPNRRSRRLYSAIALSSVERSKSGQ